MFFGLFVLVCLLFWFGLVSLLHDLSHPHSLHTKDVKFFTCLSERALDLRLRLMSLVRLVVRCLSTMDCLYPRDLPQPAREKKIDGDKFRRRVELRKKQMSYSMKLTDLRTSTGIMSMTFWPHVDH